MANNHTRAIVAAPGAPRGGSSPGRGRQQNKVGAIMAPLTKSLASEAFSRTPTSSMVDSGPVLDAVKRLRRGGGGVGGGGPGPGPGPPLGRPTVSTGRRGGGALLSSSMPPASSILPPGMMGMTRVHRSPNVHPHRASDVVLPTQLSRNLTDPSMPNHSLGLGPRMAAIAPHARKAHPPQPPSQVVVDTPRRHTSFDRRALFAMTKFRPGPEHDKGGNAPRQQYAPAVGPDGYQGGFESDVLDSSGQRSVDAASKVSSIPGRRHSWTSTRDFSDGTPQSTRGSDLFDKFGWNSSAADSSEVDDRFDVDVVGGGRVARGRGSGENENGESGESSGARAVVTQRRAATADAAQPLPGGGAVVNELDSSAAAQRTRKQVRRHSSESYLFSSGSRTWGVRSSSAGTSVRFSVGSSSQQRQQERTARELRMEVLAMSQRFRTDRINELQDENRELKSQNETLEARVAEAQEKAVDFVVKVLQSKGLLEMNELQGIMAAQGSDGGDADAAPETQHQQLQTLPEKAAPPSAQDKPPTATGDSRPAISEMSSPSKPEVGRRRSIETVTGSVASMIWKSGMISRDSAFGSTPDYSDSEAPGTVRALRERCRQLRSERNQRHEEAQSAMREVKALTADVEGLQRELMDALDGAELAERRKKRLDALERDLGKVSEELRIRDIELEAKCEELELAEEDLKALKDEMESTGKFGSGKSSFLTGIDVPSYGTPSLGQTEASKRSLDPSVFSAMDESVRADILRQMEEIIHQRDLALTTAKGDLKKGTDRIARLEDELDRARQEVVAARAAAGMYRAEMEDEIERADTEARGLLREAMREVRQLRELLDEKESTVTRLELELETAREDVEDLKEELKIERAITGNGSLGYPTSEDGMSAEYNRRGGVDAIDRLKFGGGRQDEEDLLSALVKVQIENHQLRERLGVNDK